MPIQNDLDEIRTDCYKSLPLNENYHTVKVSALFDHHERTTDVRVTDVLQDLLMDVQRLNRHVAAMREKITALESNVGLQESFQRMFDKEMAEVKRRVADLDTKVDSGKKSQAQGASGDTKQPSVVRFGDLEPGTVFTSEIGDRLYIKRSLIKSETAEPPRPLNTLALDTGDLYFTPDTWSVVPQVRHPRARKWVPAK